MSNHHTIGEEEVMKEVVVGSTVLPLPSTVQHDEDGTAHHQPQASMLPDDDASHVTARDKQRSKTTAAMAPPPPHHHRTAPPPYQHPPQPPQQHHLPPCVHFQGVHYVPAGVVAFVLYSKQQPRPTECDNYVTSRIRVQGCHLDPSGNPTPDYCENVASALRHLCNLEYVHCTFLSCVYNKYVEIEVVSSEPLNIAPGRNHILPIIMDRTGFHTTVGVVEADHRGGSRGGISSNNPHQAIYDYAYMIGTPKSRKDLLNEGLVFNDAYMRYPREMSQKQRHVHCGDGSQPSGPLKIELCSSSHTFHDTAHAARASTSSSFSSMVPALSFTSSSSSSSPSSHHDHESRIGGYPHK